MAEVASTTAAPAGAAAPRSLRPQSSAEFQQPPTKKAVLGKGSGSKGVVESALNELGNPHQNEDGYDRAAISAKGQHILAPSETFDLFGSGALLGSPSGAEQDAKKGKKAAKGGKKKDGDDSPLQEDDEMDAPSLKKLLVAVAQLGLHTSLETKIVKSISVDVLRISQKLGVLQRTTTRTKAYHEFL